jgi:transcriptional regulator with XRE-family HTH domain
MSQRALAAAIDLVDADRVGMWERGEARPHARLIPLIAHQLRIDPLTLLDGRSDTPDLTRLRVAAGLSLQDMAARTGMPVTSYHRLENRGAPQGGLPAGTAKAIAATLGISTARVIALLARSRR